MANEDSQTPPAVPAPDPSLPPVPKYGEYAAEPPATAVPPAPPAPPAAPTYGYATPAPTYGYGAPAAPAYAVSGARPRRTWDLVLTIVLLALGLIGAGIGSLYGFIFLSPALGQQVMDQAFAQQGLGPFRGDFGSAGPVLLISHLGLYLVTVGLSIFMLIKRWVTFWVPLTAGVIAAIVFWVTLFAVFLSDPNFATVSTTGV